MSKSLSVYVIGALSFFVVVGVLTLFNQFANRKRFRILERLQGVELTQLRDDDEILERPFLERTVGAFAKWLVRSIAQVTPKRFGKMVEERLERAGGPLNIKASDFLAIQGILCITFFVIGWFALKGLHIPLGKIAFLSTILALLAAYIPWFLLAKKGTKRNAELKKSLPDIMDLLVVSVEAGLSFDMALHKVADKFKGTVSQEFLKVLREIQLGKSRKDALKTMAERVDLPELSSLVNAVIQSEQLGVGLANVLRMQSDLIREKRQQWIEEQAMKAPVKILFPLVFLIFPSMFIVILGPAILNIMKVLGGVTK